MSRSRKTLRTTKKKASPVKKSAVKKSAVKKQKPIAKRKVAVKRKTKKVLAIPKGYHSITPYLIVNNAVNAIEFYKKVFGAKEKVRIQLPDGKIKHAELKIGDAKIMLADTCNKTNACSPRDFGGTPVGIHLYIKDVDHVVSRAVKAGAKLIRAIENMFYGDRCGEIEDPYGHKWNVSTHIEDVSMAQVKKRMAKLASNKSSQK